MIQFHTRRVPNGHVARAKKGAFFIVARRPGLIDDTHHRWSLCRHLAEKGIGTESAANTSIDPAPPDTSRTGRRRDARRGDKSRAEPSRNTTQLYPPKSLSHTHTSVSARAAASFVLIQQKEGIPGEERETIGREKGREEKDPPPFVFLGIIFLQSNDSNSIWYDGVCVGGSVGVGADRKRGTSEGEGGVAKRWKWQRERVWKGRRGEEEMRGVRAG